ncbi:MAG: hypothetical protein ACT4O0_09520 [Pseudonocardia sp.]
MPSTIEVLDDRTPLSFTYADLMRYHGPRFPGGVAHAFKVLERGLPLLDAEGVQRREITVRTAFPGPGARDAFELVTRAVTDGGRYVVDDGLGRPQRGRTLERYVFRLGHRDRSVTVQLREGFVVEEFIALTRAGTRTDTEERRLTVLKQEMADRLLASPATEVYDVDPAA